MNRLLRSESSNRGYFTYPTAYSALLKPLLAARLAQRYASLSLGLSTLHEHDSSTKCGITRQSDCPHSGLPADGHREEEKPKRVSQGYVNLRTWDRLLRYQPLSASSLSACPFSAARCEDAPRQRAKMVMRFETVLTVYQAIDRRGSTGQVKFPYS